jgi:2-dehydropantoate 2-reductase
MNNTTAGPGPAVGIMGAGAIGLYVGGMLAKAGAHVVFAARGRTLESLSRGLSLSRYDGFKAALKPEHYAVGGVDGLAECDVVLFCTKSGDTEAAAIDLARVLKPDATVISLQNGVGNVELLKRLVSAPSGRRRHCPLQRGPPIPQCRALLDGRPGSDRTVRRLRPSGQPG